MKDYKEHLIEELRSGNLGRREFLRRASVAGFSLAAFGSGLGNIAMAAGDPAKQKMQRGGVVRLASPMPSSAPDPVTAHDVGQIFTIQPALEYLCFPRSDWTLDPRLATSWKAVSSPKTWDFTIRQGIKWHDGSELTVDDVVASIERLLDPAVGSSAASVYHGVLSHGNVERVDDTIVRFHLDVPLVDFPYLVSAFAYQSAILPKNYEVGSYTKGGIGTGAYILKEYVHHRHAIYEPNPHYWASGMPYLDGMQVKYYADTSATVLAMQGGATDVYPILPLSGAEALYHNPKLEVSNHPSTSYRSLHMRVDKKPFDDKRVRQAVALCLNRKELVNSLFGGAAQVANDNSFAPVYVDSEMAIQDLPQRTQDYDKAKALLKEAGHADGMDVTLTLPDYLEMPQYAVAIREYCKPAGINVAINTLPSSKYYGSGDNQPWLEVPFGLTDWATRGTASQAIIPAFPCGAKWNLGHWCNKDFDRKFAKYNAELDHEKRQQIALELAKIQRDEVPFCISYWVNARRAIAKSVHGLAPAPEFSIDMRGVWMS